MKKILACFLLLFLAAQAWASEIQIEFLKPSQDSVFEKGATIAVEIEAVFPTGSTNQEVTFFVGSGTGQPTEIQLQKDSSGNYVREFTTSYETPSNLMIEANAKAIDSGTSIGTQKETGIYLEPAEISLDFKLVPEQPYYLGSRIKKIEITAKYPDGSAVPAKNWNQAYLVINGERQRLDLKDSSIGTLIADANYTMALSENVLTNQGRMHFELLDMVNDKYGNKAGNAQKDFEIEQSHPLLEIRIKKPKSNERLFPGIEIPFQIELTKKGSVSSEKVFLTDNRNLENKRDCRKTMQEAEKTFFECTEKIPSTEDRIYYVALATAVADGNEITVFKTSENEIRNTVRLEIEYPKKAESIDKISNTIEASFWYSPSAKLEGGTYKGTINSTPVEFSWKQENSAFAAEFDLKSLGTGVHELEFELEGMELEKDLFEIEIFPEGTFGFGSAEDGFPGPMIMIGAIAAIFAVFTFVVWFLVSKKKKQETMEQLQEEAALLAEMLKRIEIDYYKRKVSEEEYKKRVLEYQTKLDGIKAKINIRNKQQENKNP